MNPVCPAAPPGLPLKDDGLDLTGARFERKLLAGVAGQELAELRFLAAPTGNPANRLNQHALLVGDLQPLGRRLVHAHVTLGEDAEVPKHQHGSKAYKA